MEILTDDAYVLIFELLDNDSMMQAMKVCQRWLHIFSTSPSLLRALQFEVTGSNINQVTIPNVPLKNLTLRNFSIQNSLNHAKVSTNKSHLQAFADEIQIIVSHVRENQNLSLNQIVVEEFNDDSEDEDEGWTIYETISFRQKNRPPTVRFEVLKGFLMNFEDSLEVLEFENFNFNNEEEFYGILKNLKSFKHLKLIKCELYNFNPISEDFLPNLFSISLTKSNYNFLTAAKAFKSLQKVEIINCDETFSGFCHERFNNLLQSLTNIKELSFHGAGTSSYFDNSEFPFKIQRLNVDSFTFDCSSQKSRISFLKSQNGFLKDLRMKNLPNDHDGGEIMKFIIEEMNLETFYYRAMPIIKNGRKNYEIEKIWMSESQIKAGIEIMRQFSSIKKLKLTLNATNIDHQQIEFISSLRSDEFENIKELEIEDNSEWCNLLNFFIGFLKNFKNVKILTLNIKFDEVKEIFTEVLPHMKKLETVLILGSENYENISKYFNEVKHDVKFIQLN